MKLRSGGKAVRVAICWCVLAAGACSGGDEAPSARPSRSASSSPEPVAVFDPPQTFDEGQGVALPKGTTAKDVTLVDGVGFANTGTALAAVDLATGRSLGRAAPENESPRRQAGMQAPLVMEVGGEDLVVAPITVVIEGEGTTPGKFGVEFTAMDPMTFKRSFSRFVDLEFEARGASPPPAVTVVAVEGTVVVVTASTSERDSTVVVDLSAPRIVWRGQFAAGALSGGTVIGVENYDRLKHALVGYRLSDGTQAWRQDELYEVQVAAAGPKFALVERRDYRDGKRHLHLVDAAGKAMVPVNDAGGRAKECIFDQERTAVCFTSAVVGYVFGVDAESGELLWELRDVEAQRIAPRVTAVWHGAVYGTTPNGPVVIDARTGQDRNTKPGIAPESVNERFGIAKLQSKEVSSYPATS